jgi:hypothetical protein
MDDRKRDRSAYLCGVFSNVWYYSYEINPPSYPRPARTTRGCGFTVGALIYRSSKLIKGSFKENLMSEDKKALSEMHREHHDANWPAQHWRAWGSWFSWGSPVGLGLFFVLGAVTFAIVKFAIKL